MVRKLFISFFILLGVSINAQTLPVSELQATINSYFDNFGVFILYPSVSVSKQISENTSINGRYLVDAISSASMRSRVRIDGITSASKTKEGGGDDTPDELRHEINFGVSRLVGKSLVSFNGIYSKEHDYTSKTATLGLDIPFAKKNTVLSIGIVRSWDRIYPQIRFWEKSKDVTSLNMGISQILSKRLITQLDITFTKMKGFLSDPYQVITVISGNSYKQFENSHPDSRERKAIGIRSNYYINKGKAIQFGYRYYWDDWEIKSHTINFEYLTDYNEEISLGFGYRGYIQNETFFFKGTYTTPQKYMTVDKKLDKLYSNELSITAKFKSEYFKDTFFNFLNKDGAEFYTKFSFYQRHTESPDWHSRRKNLYAYILSFGYKFSLY